MTDLTKSILQDCYSRDDALAKLHEISQLGAKRIFSDKPIGEEETKLPSGLNGGNFDEMVEKCEEEIKNMPLLTIFCAVDLPKKESDGVGRKIRDDYGDKFLLDFKIDPKLIAGCALAWNGKYADFSFKRKMEENQSQIRKLVLN